MKQIFDVLIAGLVGCSTMVPKPKEFKLENMVIYCDTQANISRQYYKLRNEANKGDIYGYKANDGLHVMWSDWYDKNGNLMPELEVLGHEVYHEMVGEFH
jgi:hypothetical protein